MIFLSLNGIKIAIILITIESKSYLEQSVTSAHVIGQTSFGGPHPTCVSVLAQCFLALLPPCSQPQVLYLAVPFLFIFQKKTTSLDFSKHASQELQASSQKFSAGLCVSEYFVIFSHIFTCCLAFLLLLNHWQVLLFLRFRKLTLSSCVQEVGNSTGADVLSVPR